MKFQLNQITVLFTVGLLLCSLPVVFTQRGDDRQAAVSANPQQLIKDEQYEAAGPLLQSLLRKAQQRSDWAAFDSLSLQLANCWFSLSEYDSVIVFLKEALHTLSDAGQGQRYNTAKILNYLAVTYANQERYLDALKTYEDAIAIFERTSSKGKSVAYAYKNASQVYVRLDNHTLARQYFEAALQLDTGGVYKANTYAQLANGAHYIGDEHAVMRYYLLGMKEPGLSEEAMAHLRAAGSTAFVARASYDEAVSMLQSALHYYQESPDDWSDNILTCFSALADIAARRNRDGDAGTYLRKAESIGRASYKEAKSREMAKLYIQTGLFYEKELELDHALDFYQKALVQAFPYFNSLNINDNPRMEEAGLESQAMRAAAAKGMALQWKSDLALKAAAAKGLLLKDKNDLASRLNAAYCFDLSFAIAARLRRTYGNDVDKFALVANNREIYFSAALNLWQLWQQTQDTRLLARLFAFLEQTKAQVLGDALQQQRALALTGIPDSLLKKEEKLRFEAAAAAQYLRNREMAGNASDTTQLKANLFRKEKAYQDFLTDLGNRYAQFGRFMQAGLSADLSAIQSSLPDTAALLSWFDAGDRYLCVVVRQRELSAFEVPRDHFLDSVLIQFPGVLADKSQQDLNPGFYFSTAYFLFQKLLNAREIQDARSLIIVPDGQLCYLPFEVLLQAPYAGAFAGAPYLMRSKTLRYAWSATLLTLPAENRAAENGLLQIAPFPTVARDRLAVLPNSLRDAPASVGASVLKEAEANVSVFLKQAARYSIIHLSTHADAGGSEVPGIELYDRRLSLPEIYPQRFHASLVALSACETGKGHLANGEGMLSLARAFAYAGAQSLVASNWKVNERSTAELFSAFYKNLQKGLPKAEALRQAKLAYLASGEMDARKAPFYWAAFTLTGADGVVALEENHRIRWTMMTAVFLLITAISWLLRKFFRRPAALQFL